MITKAKGGTLHDRRQAAAFLTDDEAVRRLFDELAKRYADRKGGYTRVLKMVQRKGDAAPMARVELVEA